MKPSFLLGTLIVLLGGQGSAWATVNYDLTQPGVVLTLNQQAVPVKAMDLLYKLAARGQEPVSRAQVAARLVENGLLADYARAHYSPDNLFEGLRVAFRQDVLLQNELVATLRSGLQQPLDAFLKSPAGDLNKTISRRFAVSTKDMDRVFGPVGKVLLEYRLSDEQEQIAKGIPVLAYRFGGGMEQRISLFDVYASQNVQGRVMLFNREMPYLKQQAAVLLENRFVVDWAQRRSSLDAQDVAFLRKAIEDRYYRDGLMHYMGLEQDAHEGTSYLTDLATKVTPEEVSEYYNSHRDEFRQIDKVKARHIVLDNEADARKVADLLEKGGKFAEVAKQYSVAEDKASGGDLGWLIYHRDRALPWVQQLAFIQKPGVISRPVRTPDSAGEARWEIVMVEERVESFQAETSSEVRFAASEIIARKKALANFEALRKQLTAAAEVRVNPQVLPAGTLPL